MKLMKFIQKLKFREEIYPSYHFQVTIFEEA